ncbi:hypothetical protein N7448_002664 [Penicillium atrosanguineum]|uniref:Uncharacterized protein n=1 Tax=Penicillium atrosanguineum TaxID=1132637 RepID=A0A9W9LAK2_9EURO|nr:uncharacterized protein N7443_006069 [Penicillium atrosanguineum]KAJ5128954.1 hypothetical protein N7526_007120 [Penicillium atrosanguineum]KAJ5145272.1 hypothetical protein N7448_002664 [Penicillium atrosanguineum]KAJ5301067.1 hypothetical protein N7443_006069 [Penicillium atrosanguineum]KAJ5311711.1 hypothetical protein N7476_007571 [Penicillium atrosanguineum]
MLIVIDEENFQTPLDTPHPKDCPRDCYAKLVEAWQEPDLPFQGWVRCSLRGIWGLWPNTQGGDYMRKSYAPIREYRTVY